MKLKAFVQGFLYGSITFFLGPYLFIQLNEKLRFFVLIFPYSKLIGVMISMVSFILCLYDIGLFWVIGKGTPALTEPPKKLVIKGLYKYSRNPMYITQILILLGYALFFGHAMLFVYVILATIFYHTMIVFYEEPRLKKRFRKDYEKYLKQVPRWLFLRK